jgi:hypothetical protein
LAVSCVIGAAAVFVTGARAWATVHATESRCNRPPAVAPVAPQAPGAYGPAMPGQGSTPPGHDPVLPGHGVPAAGRRPAAGSWRAHTLRAAGCGAWRQMYERIHHRHH